MFILFVDTLCNLEMFLLGVVSALGDILEFLVKNIGDMIEYVFVKSELHEQIKFSQHF